MQHQRVITFSRFFEKALLNCQKTIQDNILGGIHLSSGPCELSNPEMLSSRDFVFELFMSKIENGFNVRRYVSLLLVPLLISCISCTSEIHSSRSGITLPNR